MQRKYFSHKLTAKMKRAVLLNKDRVYQEIRETATLYRLLNRWSKGEPLTLQEKAEVRAQLLDICKAIPALAIFLVPFGSIVLAVLIRFLPFDIMPSAFLSQSKPVRDGQ